VGIYQFKEMNSVCLFVAFLKIFLFETNKSLCVVCGTQCTLSATVDIRLLRISDVSRGQTGHCHELSSSATKQKTKRARKMVFV